MVEVTDTVFAGHTRPANNPEEDALARRLIGEEHRESEGDLDERLKSALLVTRGLLIAWSIFHRHRWKTVTAQVFVHGPIWKRREGLSV